MRMIVRYLTVELRNECKNAAVSLEMKEGHLSIFKFDPLLKKVKCQSLVHECKFYVENSFFAM